MAKLYPQIVLFGDSLFQESVDLQDGFSFQAALQSRFIRRFDIVNRGFSGWNTANVLRYLPEIFPGRTASSPKIDYLFILLGANDACRPPPVSIQHVPLETYKENLVKIIKFANIQAHEPKIVLVVPPPVDEIKRNKVDIEAGRPTGERKTGITAAYAEKVREVARENPGVELIDLWHAINDRAISMSPGDYQPDGPPLGSPENGKQGGLDALLHDGLHMSGDAYRIFFDLVVGKIGKLWKDDEDKTGFVFPEWRAINPPENYSP